METRLASNCSPSRPPILGVSKTKRPILLDSRVAWSDELELACTAFKTIGFEPVMEAIDGSVDGELSYDDDDLMREYSLRPDLHLILDSDYIRQRGIVDMGSES